MAFSSCVCAMNLGRASYPATWKWESNYRSPGPLISGQMKIHLSAFGQISLFLSSTWAKKNLSFLFFKNKMGPFPINQSLHPPIASMGRAPTANGVPIPNWWLQPALCARCWRSDTSATALLQHPANLSLIFCQHKEKHQAWENRPQHSVLQKHRFSFPPVWLIQSVAQAVCPSQITPGILATKNTITWNKWFSSVTVSGWKLYQQSWTVVRASSSHHHVMLLDWATTAGGSLRQDSFRISDWFML